MSSNRNMWQKMLKTKFSSEWVIKTKTNKLIFFSYLNFVTYTWSFRCFEVKLNIIFPKIKSICFECKDAGWALFITKIKRFGAVSVNSESKNRQLTAGIIPGGLCKGCLLLLSPPRTCCSRASDSPAALRWVNTTAKLEPEHKQPRGARGEPRNDHFNDKTRSQRAPTESAQNPASLNFACMGGEGRGGRGENGTVFPEETRTFGSTYLPLTGGDSTEERGAVNGSPSSGGFRSPPSCYCRGALTSRPCHGTMLAFLLPSRHVTTALHNSGGTGPVPRPWLVGRRGGSP